MKSRVLGAKGNKARPGKHSGWRRASEVEQGMAEPSKLQKRAVQAVQTSKEGRQQASSWYGTLHAARSTSTSSSSMAFYAGQRQHQQQVGARTPSPTLSLSMTAAVGRVPGCCPRQAGLEAGRLAVWRSAWSRLHRRGSARYTGAYVGVALSAGQPGHAGRSNPTPCRSPPLGSSLFIEAARLWALLCEHAPCWSSKRAASASQPAAAGPHGQIGVRGACLSLALPAGQGLAPATATDCLLLLSCVLCGATPSARRAGTDASDQLSPTWHEAGSKQEQRSLGVVPIWIRLSPRSGQGKARRGEARPGCAGLGWAVPTMLGAALPRPGSFDRRRSSSRTSSLVPSHLSLRT
ncbi:uncharacterized protein PSFLO_07352 [Pseudozyma flocculosa]|uniref:Uncharacterized protein n=1 Tax=Pseudozyma flocculosa TaxID=84751 RepID=A0A5C3FC64_9BASI|nr:uncharacterized protein PSFLO_07352 [Pseudozyma flocculosa]